MQITVTRQHFSESCTIGELTIEGDDIKLYTLEDVDRRLSQTDDLAVIKQSKVFGQTAIPYGTYEVAMTYSERFKRVMPQLLNVKGFAGVRIHSGNTSDQTEGCILCGYKKDVVNNMVLNSRAAIGELYMILDEACKKEKVFLTITKADIAA
jgi:hypothetical protein